MPVQGVLEVSAAKTLGEREWPQTEAMQAVYSLGDRLVEGGMPVAEMFEELEETEWALNRVETLVEMLIRAHAENHAPGALHTCPDPICRQLVEVRA